VAADGAGAQLLLRAALCPLAGWLAGVAAERRAGFADALVTVLWEAGTLALAWTAVVDAARPEMLTALDAALVAWWA
jgi:hypothetical protein